MSSHSKSLQSWSWLKLMVLAVLAVTMAGLHPAKGAAPTYSIRNAGFEFTDAYLQFPRINSSGQVVGFSRTPGSPNSQPQVCVTDTAFNARTFIGTLGGYVIGRGYGINDAGTVVGEAFRGGPQSQGLRWSPPVGPLVALSRLPTGLCATARDINSAGVAAGFSCANGQIIPRAVFWSVDGTITDIGTFGGFSSSAYAINETGQMTGEATLPNGSVHAFRYTPGAGMVDLGTLATGQNSIGEDINDAGEVCGWSNTAGSNGLTAFKHSPGGGLIELGMLTAGTYSLAQGIGPDGAVVGESDGRAFLWTQTSGMLDLNTLIPAGSGWVLERATDINAAGQITGVGYYNKTEAVFRLTPNSEPPAAPTGLAAVVYTSSMVELNWQENNSDETGFQIERRLTTGSTFTLVGSVGPNIRTFQDQTVTAGSNYTYRVLTVRSGVVSLPSNHARAEIPAGGVLALTPASLAISTNLPNTEGSGSLTLRNTGSGNLSLFIGSLNAPFQVHSRSDLKPGPALLRPRQTASLIIAFKPADVGTFGTSLAIWSTDPSRGFTQVGITGKTADGKLAITPRAPLELEAELDQTKTGVITITNSGTGRLDGEVGTLAAPFRVRSGGGTFRLGPRATRKVEIEYSPETTEVSEATLQITSTDPANPSVSYSIRGVPRYPIPELSSETIAFGNLVVGTSQTRALTVKNIGTGTLKLYAGATHNGPFRFQWPATLSRIAPGRNVRINITYTPNLEIRDAGVLTFSVGEPPNILSVTLSGTGVVLRPAIQISPTRVDFPATTVGQQRSQTITVTNTGQATLQFRTLILLAAPFTETLPGGFITLAPGRSRTFTVGFHPTEAGNFAGTVHLSTNVNPNHTVNIPLTGQGVSAGL